MCCASVQLSDSRGRGRVSVKTYSINSKLGSRFQVFDPSIAEGSFPVGFNNRRARRSKISFLYSYSVRWLGLFSFQDYLTLSSVARCTLPRRQVFVNDPVKITATRGKIFTSPYHHFRCSRWEIKHSRLHIAQNPGAHSALSPKPRR